MAKKLSRIYLLSKLWAVFLEGPTTGGYPFEPLQLPPGFRGKVVMNAHLCNGCGLCVQDCPASALKIERFDKQHFRIVYNPARCAYCGQCAISCHRGAIHLTNDFNPAVQHIGNLIEVLVERGLPKG